MSDEISSVSQQELKSLYKNNLPNLNFFEPKEFSKHHVPKDDNNFFTGIIIGPSGTGKNVIYEELHKYWFNKQYDKFVIFSQSIKKKSKKKGSYDFIDQKRIVKYNDYDHNYLKAIMDHNDELDEMNKPMIKTLVVFDDCLDKKTKDDDVIIKACKQGRHHSVSTMFIQQDVINQLSAECRSQANLWIFLQQGSKERRISISKEYFSHLSSDEFTGNMKDSEFWSQLIKRYTIEIEYGALIIFPRPLGDVRFNFMNNVFQYKVPYKSTLILKNRTYINIYICMLP